MGEITDGTLVVYLGADGGINTGLRHAGAGAWDGRLDGLTDKKTPTKDVLHAFAGFMGFKKGNSGDDSKASCSAWIRAKAERPFWFFGMCTCMPMGLGGDKARMELAKAAWPQTALQSPEKRVTCQKHPRARL
jgi:hypothetical protein